MSISSGLGMAALASLCWDIRHDDDTVLHCTEPAGHRGDHFHAYTRRHWPRLPTNEAEQNDRARR
ncbi:hypothetical protein ACGFSB_22045 [Streptomyces sp. NPDC048441]|uniref:hypothetical protein n=1 Tax=Streptomyces sp. NPDC048441 TaxID=3365552 RepID=UPI00371098D9